LVGMKIFMGNDRVTMYMVLENLIVTDLNHILTEM